MMRNGSTDKEIVSALKVALNHRAKNGFEAEKRRDNNIPISESMATIGG
jgi:cyclic pyranopterin phosphate synthase